MTGQEQTPRRLFDALLACYGPQGWWPAETVFEVMAGAVLVQRTAWRNAEAALRGLRQAGIADWDTLTQVPPGVLESAIRPSGFYRGKARRLVALGRLVQSAGGAEAIARMPTETLTARLLGVHGVGPETADAILLYAFDRPVFVVDAYARRLFERLGYPDAVAADDDALKRRIECTLPGAPELNELHALIVAHAKARCTATPDCGPCCLRACCGYARGAANP